jgi:hypothetical protein
MPSVYSLEVLTFNMAELTDSSRTELLGGLEGRIPEEFSLGIMDSNQRCTGPSQLRSDRLEPPETACPVCQA